MGHVIKIGVLCPADIAFNRFMPALMQCEHFQYAGVGTSSPNEWQKSEHLPKRTQGSAERALRFKNQYGGEIFDSYQAVLESSEIEAVYIPLPPALHFYWAHKALTCGKHVLLEKPSTTSFNDTAALVNCANGHNLALNENYMFLYHSQLDFVKKFISDGTLGCIRLIRMAFGFPFRGTQDFRYNPLMGGGALFDCGGYPLKLATHLLGDSAKVAHSSLTFDPKFGIDIAGNATLSNDSGLTAQIAFGMDNSYKCELEIWGSNATLFTNRIFTAGSDFSPTFTVSKASGNEQIVLSPDNSFLRSIEHFYDCIVNKHLRSNEYESIKRQSMMVQAIMGKVER